MTGVAVRAAPIWAESVMGCFPNGAIVSFDHDLRYMSAAGGALAQVGLCPTMLEGRTIFEAFDPVLAATVEPLYRRALGDQESTADVVYRDRVFLLRVAPLRGLDGETLGGICLADDVTAARRSARDLQESEEAPHTITDLRRLRADGIGIAIDDFGTGYASLSYLAALPISCLKVDQSFIAGLPDDPTCVTIVRATVGLASDLGMGCVVEGVETMAQLEALPQSAGLLAQGFLFSTPQPGSADLPTFLHPDQAVR